MALWQFDKQVCGWLYPTISSCLHCVAHTRVPQPLNDQQTTEEMALIS